MEQNLKKNMLWNAAGNIVYLACQWLITVLVTNLGQFRDAGILSIAMSVSSTFQTIAMFGIRNFQVSDMDRKYSDTCYVSFRMISCAAAMVCCMAFSLISGYRSEQLFAIFLFMLFRLAEDFSDVLHGIAQKNERLDIAGKSFAIKGIGILIFFLVGYRMSGKLTVGLLMMALFSCLCTVLYDALVVRKLSEYRFFEKSLKWFSLAKETLPLCIYLFLSSAIATVPKLILEKQCGEEILGAYSSIFAPALLISAAASYLYSPFVTIFAKVYHEDDKKAFFRLFIKITVAIVLFAAVAIVAAVFLGDFALTLIFGEKINDYVYLLVPIFVSIFVSAYFTFLCTLEIIFRDFLGLLSACGIGLLSEILLTGDWIAHAGINATSYSFILASAIGALILLLRMLWILLKKQRKGVEHG